MKVVVFFWIFIAAFPLVQGEVGSLKHLSYTVLLLHQAAFSRSSIVTFPTRFLIKMQLLGLRSLKNVPLFCFIGPRLMAHATDISFKILVSNFCIGSDRVKYIEIYIFCMD